MAEKEKIQAENQLNESKRLEQEAIAYFTEAKKEVDAAESILKSTPVANSVLFAVAEANLVKARVKLSTAFIKRKNAEIRRMSSETNLEQKKQNKETKNKQFNDAKSYLNTCQEKFTNAKTQLEVIY